MKTTLVCLLLSACTTDSQSIQNVRPHDPDGCWAYSRGMPSPNAAWLEGPRTSCLTAPALDLAAPTLYSQCDPVVTSPSRCSLQSGDQFCSNGRWTLLCRRNAECPAGFLCTYSDGTGDVPTWVIPQFGTCEQSCASNLDCVRCDHECHPDLHVCLPKAAP